MSEEKVVEEGTSVPSLTPTYTPSLAFATPAYLATVSCSYVASLTCSVVDLDKLGIRTKLLWLTHCSLLPRARNALVAQFMASDFTHMLFVDGDISWPRDAVLKLLRYDLPLVGIAGLRRGGDAKPCIRPLSEENNSVEYDRETGLVRVGAVGTGFMMIRRDVFETMERAYPNLKLPAGEEMAPETDEHYYGFFNLSLGESEDFAFCQRYRAVGGEVYVDPRISLKHQGHTVYEGALTDYMKFPELDEEGTGQPGQGELFKLGDAAA